MNPVAVPQQMLVSVERWVPSVFQLSEEKTSWKILFRYKIIINDSKLYYYYLVVSNG